MGGMGKNIRKMAALKLTARQLGLLRRCLGPGGVAHASRMLSPAVLQQSRMGSGGPAPWNYLWKPGPYPKTEEEMCAAAKKYGLIREDYRPYPDNGLVWATTLTLGGVLVPRDPG